MIAFRRRYSSLAILIWCNRLINWIIWAKNSSALHWAAACSSIMKSVANTSLLKIGFVVDDALFGLNDAGVFGGELYWWDLIKKKMEKRKIRLNKLKNETNRLVNLNASDNANISAHVDCRRRIWSFSVKSEKPGICLAQPIVATNSLSTKSLRIHRFLYWVDDTDDRLPLEFGLDICAFAFDNIGSGSQLINAATIRLSKNSCYGKENRFII